MFVLKYRIKNFYGYRRSEIWVILIESCNRKGLNIIWAEVCSDHVHILLEIPPQIIILSFIGFLKVKISIIIYLIMTKFNI